MRDAQSVGADRNTGAGASPLDLDALRRCVDLMRADRELGELVRDKLRDEPWRSVAEFCSYSLQMDALQLRPWQQPPATGGTADADELADRLRAAGLSRFEPDPAAALAAKEKLGPRATELLPTMGTKPKRPRA